MANNDPQKESNFIKNRSKLIELKGVSKVLCRQISRLERQKDIDTDDEETLAKKMGRVRDLIDEILPRN